jgi:hypothetical protein
MSSTPFPVRTPDDAPAVSDGALDGRLFGDARVPVPSSHRGGGLLSWVDSAAFVLEAG